MWQKDKTIMKETNSHFLSCTEKLNNIVTQIFGYASIIVLVAMMLLTVSDVFCRYAFNKPIMGTPEVVTLMMVTLGFVAIVLCTGKRTHIKVDILNKYIPSTAKAISEGFYALCGTGLFIFISWQNFVQAGVIRDTDNITQILDIPYYPFYLITSFSCGVVALLLFINMLLCIVKVVHK